MKLTVEDVAKRTGLSVNTVRAYAWRMKLGKREGRHKVFTSIEAKLIDSGKLPPLQRAKAKASKKNQKE